jgi:hypothetical protein
VWSALNPSTKHTRFVFKGLNGMVICEQWLEKCVELAVVA